MTSISITGLLTIIFVLVDDWYQAYRYKVLKGKAGKKPVFTDGEVITLMLAHDFIPYPAEAQMWSFPCELSGFVSGTGRSEPIQSPSSSLAIIGGTITAVLDCPKRLALAHELLVGYERLIDVARAEI